jgi:hypothetical protein
MEERISRRELSALAAVGIGSLALPKAFAGGIAAPGSPGGGDQDEDGHDAASQLRRLSRVADLLQKASSRLDAIQAGWSVPGTPDQPGVLTVLNTVSATANHAVIVANALVATMNPH